MDRLFRYIETAAALPGQSGGYDVIIVSTNSSFEARFWQERLEASRGIVSNPDCRIYSIFEDWITDEGAGNLLGTLYAWEQASEIHLAMTGRTLSDALSEGLSVAMYHLAGMGTRMAPLPAAECNAKSAVKLPSLITLDGRETPMTVLEAVLLQTGPFAATRKGRLSVWWGDQIFIPSFYDSPGTHHIEILAQETEVSESLENYGLLLFRDEGDCLQREKMPYRKILELVPADSHGKRTAGMSLGSFSITNAFLQALCAEFAREIKERKLRLNTDGDLWQPLTSTCEDYCGTGRKESLWKRVHGLKESFEAHSPVTLRQFGYLNIGASYWWDFGQLSLYYRNLMMMLEQSTEAEAMRRFFKLPLPSADNPWQSIICGSTIMAGKAANSIIINSCIGHAELEHALVIESTIAGSLTGSHVLSYKNIEDHDLALEQHEASAGVILPGGKRIRMRRIINQHLPEHWKEQILDNPLSFRDLWKMLKQADRKELDSTFHDESQARACRIRASGKR